MSNPWLSVPLSEYEQHMNSAEVQQLDVLSDLFAEAVRRCRPSSIAVLGIAGGNGLDHIDNRITSRVVGLDINPQYLEAVGERYSHLVRLELHCVDLSQQTLETEPVQLVHAALIFEHAGTGRCLENALFNNCSRRGVVCRAPVADRKRTNSWPEPVLLDSAPEVSLFLDQFRMVVQIARRTWISADSPNNTHATRRQGFLDGDFPRAGGTAPAVKPRLYTQ